MQLLQTLELPPESANYFTNHDFHCLSLAIRQLDACQNCNGNKSFDCIKITPYIDGDRVYFKETHCALNAQFKQKSLETDILNRANIPLIFRNKYAYNDFITSDNNAEAVDAAEDAVFNDTGVYYFGNCGTGKTLLACIIANERAKLGKSSLFISIADFLDDIRDFNNNSIKYADQLTQREKLLNVYNSKCLIIDDLGTEKPTEWSCEILFKILNTRYNNNAQTIITSNLSIQELGARLQRFNGDRITRRIQHLCKIIALN